MATSASAGMRFATVPSVPRLKKLSRSTPNSPIMAANTPMRMKKSVKRRMKNLNIVLGNVVPHKKNALQARCSDGCLTQTINNPF